MGPLENAYELHLDDLNAYPVEPKQFQHQQEELEHSELLFMTPVAISMNDVLVEMLSTFKAAVVSDRFSSTSRTCWLASRDDEFTLLFVVDSVIKDGLTRVTIDAWSPIIDIREVLLDRIAKTKIGQVNYRLESLHASWVVERLEGQHVISLHLDSHNPEPLATIFLALEYRGVLSEVLQLTPHGNEVEFSVVFDEALLTAKNTDLADETFLAIFLSDAEWKFHSNYHVIKFTWIDSLLNRIEKRLQDHRRFSNLDELGGELGLSPSVECEKIIRTLLIEVCNRLNLEGCSTSRVSDHCQRSAILILMVLCFNPSRGLTGYMQMLLKSEDTLIASLGSERTWRDHLTQIVSASTDFRPMSYKVTGSRKNRIRGRPPIQLLPTLPAIDLFHRLIEEPSSVVCEHCRFRE